MAHNHPMTITTETRHQVAARWQSAVPVGIGLIVAELLLAFLWYPWVVDHLVFDSSLPYEVLRLLIVAPEYALVAIAVYLVARRPALRLPAVALALLAGLVVWGWSIVNSRLAHTPADIAAHRQLLDTLSWISIISVPTLAGLGGGGVTRQGGPPSRRWPLWPGASPVARAASGCWPCRWHRPCTGGSSTATGPSASRCTSAYGASRRWAWGS
jgi:hypothetical protein